MTKTSQCRIRGEPEIEVPHKEKTITFIYDQHGPSNYDEVSQSITGSNLDRPTMAETASLLHQVFQGDEIEFSRIKDLMKNRWLWAFTGTLYTPDKGVYVQDNPKIKEGMPIMEETGLVEKLEARDPSVRFVSSGFPIGPMTPIQLGKNPYLIALAGEEGAEKLAQVADKHPNKPCLWSYGAVVIPTARVSSLNSERYLGDHWLSINSHEFSIIKGGCAFGVQKNTT